MTKIKHLEQKFAFAHYELISACDANELQLYLFLKLYAINKSSAFPSASTVTEQLGWGRERFFKTIKDMEKKGRLRIIRGKGVSNLYDITWYDTLNQFGNRTGGSSETERGVVRKPNSNYKKETKRKKTIDNFSFKGEDLGFVMS